MIDRDLADLYQVKTMALNQAVKRNIERFPSEFMFRLTNIEKGELITNCDRFKTIKHSQNCPAAFTEHGILMLSSVLNSQRAIQVNIQIMRTFTKLKEMMLNFADLKAKLEKMEREYDGKFAVVFEAIKQLMQPEIKPVKRIGFVVDQRTEKPKI